MQGDQSENGDTGKFTPITVRYLLTTLLEMRELPSSFPETEVTGVRGPLTLAGLTGEGAYLYVEAGIQTNEGNELRCLRTRADESVRF